jgi:hypothetical protein
MKRSHIAHATDLYADIGLRACGQDWPKSTAKTGERKEAA